MASPQLENGHTRIANELMEAIAKLKLPNYESRVLIAILRETYGWNKKHREVSITRIQKITGLKRRHVSRSIEGLERKKIVTSSGDSFVAKRGIQKDYTKWNLSPPQVPATIVTSSGPKLACTGDDLVTSSGPRTPPEHRTGRAFTDTLKQKAIIKTNPDVFSLKKRYAHPTLIDSAFKAIRSTRKSGRVAESVLIAQLKKWEEYPVEQVEAGIRIYLEKDYAGETKREEYLMGIIRNNCDRQAGTAKPECKTPEWF